MLLLTLTIITGSIWAKPVWGTWWTWDPQLTTTFILWVLYAVYLVLRSGAGGRGKKARYSAIFAIIAYVDLPVVYVSARIKRGISPVVFGPGGGGIDPAMMHTLLVTLLGFTLLFVLLLGERTRIMNMENQLYARGGARGVVCDGIFPLVKLSGLGLSYRLCALPAREVGFGKEKVALRR